MSTADIDALTAALAAPFDPSEVKFKPAVVKGNRAMALHYVDARVVQDRLDDVVGPMNWADEYEFLPDGSCLCRLKLRIGAEWVTKMDVGSESEQPDSGDRHKAAVSDALKRAAVKFGIGRYLYRIPSAWFDYDPAKKQFVRPPTLPASALPTKAQPAKAAAPAKKAAAKALPKDGEEFARRLKAKDTALAEEGRCGPGELQSAVEQWAAAEGLPDDHNAWTNEHIADATDEIRRFIASLDARQVEVPA